MLGWASSQFEKLSVAVAPPPTDANGRFLYAVQKGDEEGALGCLHEIDAARAVLNPTKGSYAIHLACQNSMDRLIRALLNVPGVDLTFIDSQGNTPLHYATMSTDRARALSVIKMLVTEYGASPCSKNSAGQTPYDLAGLDMVRQYLLPLQLQAETQQAIDNGGVGLPPGIDMGGLRIQNPAAPPPPIIPGMNMPLAPAPMSSPAPHHYQTPQHDAIPNPPASGGSRQQQGRGGYALSGGSSAAIYKPTDGKRVYKADGFHSSSSDVNLQRKYGHVSVSGATGHPPPPSSGNAGTAFPAAAAGGPPGANPFAGGANPYASGGTKSRYVSYDAVTGQTSTVPSRPVAPGGYAAAPAAVATPNYAVFSPGGATPAPVPAINNGYNPAAPGQMHQQQQPQAYQQPHQSHQQDAMAGSAAYPNSAGNQHYQNPAQQQQQYHQGYQQPQAQQPQVQQPAAAFAPAAAGPVYGQQLQQPQHQQYEMPAQTAAYTPAQPYSQQPEQQQQPVTSDVASAAATQPGSAPAPAPAVASQGSIAPSPVSGGFSLAEQQENAASATHLFSSPSKDVVSPVQATSAPVGSQDPPAAVSPVQQNQPSTTGPAAASDLFASAPVPTADTTAAAATTSAPVAAASFAASPPHQPAPVSASDLFGSPPAATSSSAAQEMFAAPGNGPTPAASQVNAANTPPHGERAASPAASDEHLDDVPLSPDGKPPTTASVSQYAPVEAHASQGFAQTPPVQSQNFANQGFAQPAPAQSFDYANQGFAQPAPTQTQNPPAGAVPGAESLFAAIGMPPPPFSANKR